MNERERLVELLCGVTCDAYCQESTHGQCRSVQKLNLCQLRHIADHLLANGVIVPPCKVGESCYPLPRYRTPIVERKISRITYSARNIIIGYYENDGQYRPPLRTRILGEDVFLTEAEAEKALAERKQK